MPIFVRPAAQPDSVPPYMEHPRPCSLAACPACGDTAEGWGETRHGADLDACRRLSGRCRCMAAAGGVRFLLDGTPEGCTLWLEDGGGVLRRCHLFGGAVCTPVGVYEPGGLPLIVCAGELEAFRPGEKAKRVKFAPSHAEGHAAFFRKKGYRVQIAVGLPTALHGDPLPPIVVERKPKKKAVRK